ncbi:unnamed protein product [Owenia fusiformis]|uniref:Extracellular globin n=1 Tax=Owenia fusiformis TaxID=6347 RepID=A0A8S4P2T6_OWEFU|nr:unnamed protein product [Owenia fusiformis]
MKLLMVVAIALLGLAYVNAERECNALTKLKVQAQWSFVYGAGPARARAGAVIFRRFLQRHPEAQKIFARVKGEFTSSPEFLAHVARVLGGFDMVISQLNNPMVFQSLLNHLYDQHEARGGMLPEYYDEFGFQVARVLAEYLDDFDEEAFVSCYKLVAKGLKGLYKVAPQEGRRYYRRF